MALQLRTTSLWDFDTHAVIEGTLVMVGEVMMGVGTPNARLIPTYIFELEDGSRFKVLGSHKLAESLFKTDVGKYVKITKKAQIKLKGGRKLNDFEVLVEEDSDAVEGPAGV